MCSYFLDQVKSYEATICTSCKWCVLFWLRLECIMFQSRRDGTKECTTFVRSSWERRDLTFSHAIGLALWQCWSAGQSVHHFDPDWNTSTIIGQMCMVPREWILLSLVVLIYSHTHFSGWIVITLVIPWWWPNTCRTNDIPISLCWRGLFRDTETIWILWTHKTKCYCFISQYGGLNAVLKVF